MDAHGLIEWLMVSANSAAARVPGTETLYRVQEARDRKATYAYGKGRHASLGLEAYTHFTSPIRRYADQVVHRALLGEPVEVDLDAHNDRDRRHAKFKRDMDVLAFVRSNPPAVCKGVVLPFRFSEKHQQHKVDVRIEGVNVHVPLRLNSAKTQHIVTTALMDDGSLAVTDVHSGDTHTLFEGNVVSVHVVCRPSEPLLKNKCVVKITK